MGTAGDSSFPAAAAQGKEGTAGEEGEGGGLGHLEYQGLQALISGHGVEGCGIARDGSPTDLAYPVSICGQCPGGGGHGIE